MHPVTLRHIRSRMDWGLDVAWDFSIKQPHDLEAHGNGLSVTGEEKGSTGPIISVSINADGRKIKTRP